MGGAADDFYRAMGAAAAIVTASATAAGAMGFLGDILSYVF